MSHRASVRSGGRGDAVGEGVGVLVAGDGSGSFWTRPSEAWLLPTPTPHHPSSMLYPCWKPAPLR